MHAMHLVFLSETADTTVLSLFNNHTIIESWAEQNSSLRTKMQQMHVITRGVVIMGGGGRRMSRRY